MEWHNRGITDKEKILKIIMMKTYSGLIEFHPKMNDISEIMMFFCRKHKHKSLNVLNSTGEFLKKIASN